MVDPVTGAAALGLIGKAIDALNKLLSLSQDKAVNQVASELHAHILSLQKEVGLTYAKELDLLQIKDHLEKECVRLKDWAAEKQQYSRTEIATGIFAYVQKDFMGKLENAHKYCCNCLDNQKKSTLQQFNIPVGRLIGLSCGGGCPNLEFRQYKEQLPANRVAK